MIVVGVTGNLASGKSAAAQSFKELGARVVDADLLARKLTKKGTVLYKAILKIFGKDFAARGGELDRRKLAWHVFSHPEDLRKLNVLIHPGVIFEAYKVLEAERDKKDRMVVLDVPLLFESHMERMADFTVVVRSSRTAMMRRAAKRGVPPALARKILASQWPSAKKARLANYVIDNDGTVAGRRAKVKKVYADILRDAKKR